jgi:hypothetical protein
MGKTSDLNLTIPKIFLIFRVSPSREFSMTPAGTVPINSSSSQGASLTIGVKVQSAGPHEPCSAQAQEWKLKLLRHY